MLLYPDPWGRWWSPNLTTAQLTQHLTQRGWEMSVLFLKTDSWCLLRKFWVTPLKINILHIIMEVWFRSFSFPCMGDGCRFQPLIFQGVRFHVSPERIRTTYLEDQIPTWRIRSLFGGSDPSFFLKWLITQWLVSPLPVSTVVLFHTS